MISRRRRDAVAAFRGRWDRSYSAPLATAVAAALLTAVLIFTPLRFTYRSLELRVSLETAQGVITILVAFLLYGRHRRTGLWSDFLGAYALALFGLTGLVFALLPAVVGPAPRLTFDRFETWAPLSSRTVAAGALAWAALTSRRWLRVERSAVLLTGALAVTLLAVASGVTLAGGTLPPVVQEVHEASPQRPDLDAPAALLAAQLLLVGLFAAAATGFARQSRRGPNPLITALACGCVLAAFARVNFFLYPSIYTDVVHVGDILRLLFFLVLLAGAVVEIGGYWRLEAEAAAGRERQRLARELHDGLAQELAFIRSHTSAMARGVSPAGVTPLVAQAAERAMAESRRVVDALRVDSTSSIEQLLHDATNDVARPAGAEVEVTVEGEMWLPAAAHAEVADIVRRATTTAVRRRAASRVSVQLRTSGGRALLIVEDDGAAEPPGAGGKDIEQWARDLGATYRVDAVAGGGTRIEVTLPWRPGQRMRRRRGVRAVPGVTPAERAMEQP